MEDDPLKQVFTNLHANIIERVNPDSAIDALLSKNILSTDDYHELRQVQGSKDRCRDLLSRLYCSSHSETFIQLRLALLDEYSWIVSEIDDQLTSLTAQRQQTHQGRFIDGEFLSAPCRSV